MKSTDLQDFSQWQKWGRDAVSAAPKCSGVYVFRLAGKVFGHFKGQSDIVYIGSATDGTIHDRLSTHRSDRRDALDIGRRLGAANMGDFEVAWKNLAAEQARTQEARLLRDYYLDHSELPPDNRIEPLREKRIAFEALIKCLQTHPDCRGQSPESLRELAEQLLVALEKMQSDQSP